MIAKGIGTHMDLEDKVIDEILETLLRPHKHKHRKAQKDSSQSNTEATSDARESLLKKESSNLNGKGKTINQSAPII